ncbi:lysylphosphatidylglycerol synthase transmembrane domain-containing protein [Dyella sp.]|jgi:uncharacterized membrane protein YbhN (UPF0104 family)|uniref:lysylphosphatidylglycerol synthase transmembrane domain-containing protein n=1 Tax=Dyella sp. TaxID=1869338 RepID=UPI002D78BB83|nr:lysylphosphatidylglycerol synthase transmembrane domain-containing protein [Dyella sp.]HET6430809.1 lysylphosphatidylglycerol synthase transmembrane domain-containing protein [Dyella sp.]
MTVRQAKLRRSLRNGVVTLIVVACIAATTRLFDWSSVAAALAHLRAGLLVGAGAPLLLLIALLRGWRWLVVLGMRPTPRLLWQSFCANGAAAGLASLTPFQVGEIVKIRLIPDHHGSAWRLGVSAFFVERMLDLGTMCCVCLAGLSVRFGIAWAALPALCIPLLGAFIGSHVARRLPLPARLRPYVEVLLHLPRTVAAAALSLPIWGLYCVLWWIALQAMNVPILWHQVAILLGAVMLAVVVSMTPGGLGVSELSSRGLLLWLGQTPAQAEAGAIALRLLTPIIVLVGVACLLPLIRQLRKPPH